MCRLEGKKVKCIFAARQERKLGKMKQENTRRGATHETRALGVGGSCEKREVSREQDKS